MKFYRAAMLAAAIAIVLMPSVARAHHPHVVVTKAAGVPIGGGASAAGLVAGFLGGILVVGIIHEAQGPRCASNSKYNIAHGYNDPRFWRPICQRDPKPIRVRG